MYHGTELSLRQLHRNLRRLGMFRRKNSDDINTNSSQSNEKLTHRVPVRLISKTVDPDGVMNRCRHRLDLRL